MPLPYVSSKIAGWVLVASSLAVAGAGCRSLSPELGTEEKFESHSSKLDSHVFALAFRYLVYEVDSLNPVGDNHGVTCDQGVRVYLVDADARTLRLRSAIQPRPGMYRATEAHLEGWDGDTLLVRVRGRATKKSPDVDVVHYFRIREDGIAAQIPSLPPGLLSQRPATDGSSPPLPDSRPARFVDVQTRFAGNDTRYRYFDIKTERSSEWRPFLVFNKTDNTKAFVSEAP
jgi:hypothetical protein